MSNFQSINWKSEKLNYIDTRSGLEVTQLTNFKGHSHHLYFTNPGWFDNGNKLLFGSDRNNFTNLFSCDLRSGEVVQHTNIIPKDKNYYFNFLTATINSTKDEVYYPLYDKIFALNLKNQEERIIYEFPKGYLKSMLNCTADGKYLCIALFKDVSDKIKVDYDRGYVGFSQTFREHPHSMIIKIDIEKATSEIVWEENNWIGHVNTSPTQPNLLTFCHEGPWTSVDHRIWGFDLNTKEAWKIRPKKGKEHFGHEYWLADGIHIGYHGGLENGKKIFGFIKYDNTENREIDFPFPTGHIHSNDMERIVGDAGKVIRFWIWDEEEQTYVGPLVLCEHDSTMKIQILHVHPRFSPDGKYIIFTSDRKGYGNVYKLDLPSEDELLNLPFEIL